MALHYNIIMVLGTYRAQHQNVWCDCLVSHTNCYTVAMGNGTGSSLRSWVL